MSDLYQSLAHARWNCKYHVGGVPKRRKKTLYGDIRKALGPIFPEGARQKECHISEGHVMPDHVHRCSESPPKDAGASMIGFLKGQSAIAMARQFSERERNLTGAHFWAQGYAVSTVGFEREPVRAYIREQEHGDEHGRF
jgi:putative transposase